jgi:hypothetical protein
MVVQRAEIDDDGGLAYVTRGGHTLIERCVGAAQLAGVRVTQGEGTSVLPAISSPVLGLFGESLE